MKYRNIYTTFIALRVQTELKNIKTFQIKGLAQYNVLKVIQNAKEVLTEVNMNVCTVSQDRIPCVSPISQKYYKIYRTKPQDRIPKVCLTDPLFKANISNYRKSITKKET